MVSLIALLSEAAERTDRTLPLAAVPLVVSLLAVDKLRRVAGFDGVNFGVSFGFPSAVTGGWTFLSLPSGGPGMTVYPSNLPSFAVATAAATLVTAALGAGYLGSLRRAIAGKQRQFLADTRAYVAPLLLFQAASLAASLTFVGAALVSPALLVVVVPVLVALAYLFYATPYLVVTGDRSVVSALSASYGYATEGGEYASFFLRYLAATAVVSLPAVPLFTSLGLIGSLAGMVVLAPVGLLFDDATMAFLRDLDSAASVPTFPGAGDPPEPAIRRVRDGKN